VQSEATITSFETLELWIYAFTGVSMYSDEFWVKVTRLAQTSKKIDPPVYHQLQNLEKRDPNQRIHVHSIYY
jgi:hypothetical protein